MMNLLEVSDLPFIVGKVEHLSPGVLAATSVSIARTSKKKSAEAIAATDFFRSLSRTSIHEGQSRRCPLMFLACTDARQEEVIEFRPENGNVFRGVNAEPNLVALDPDNGNRDTRTDVDLFSRLPGQNKHGIHPFCES